MSLVLDRGVEAKLRRKVRQFEVWMADLGETVGSVQGGERPVLVISNEKSNIHSGIVIVSPISAQVHKAKLPTHILVSPLDSEIDRDSFIMFEQHITLSKEQLKYRMFQMPKHYINRIVNGIKKSTEVFEIF